MPPRGDPREDPGVSGSVLIVEDDETVAGLLEFALRRDGFATTVVRDGRAGIDHVRASGPADAVVLDLMLPCRDGFAVAAAIRASPGWAGVPILVVSARAGDADRERARAAGAAAFVAKPFHPRELVTRVRELVNGAG
jgi:DNA-binding response OmpR family regulator